MVDSPKDAKFTITNASNHWKLSNQGRVSTGGVFSGCTRSMVKSHCMPGRLFANADDPDFQNASDDEIER